MEEIFLKRLRRGCGGRGRRGMVRVKKCDRAQEKAQLSRNKCICQDFICMDAGTSIQATAILNLGVHTPLRGLWSLGSLLYKVQGSAYISGGSETSEVWVCILNQDHKRLWGQGNSTGAILSPGTCSNVWWYC